MPTPLILQIPSPCSEDWAAMTPAAQGRYCAACQETVIDFTSMTDAEVVAWLARHSAPICGRMREEQLERLLVPAAVPAPRWRAWLAAALALVGVRQVLPSPVQAQAPVMRPHTADRANAPQLPHVASRSITIQGQVVDTTGAPIPFTSLTLAKLKSHALSNENGQFTLQISAEQITQHPTDTLMFMGLGYKKYILPIDFRSASALVEIRPELHKRNVTLQGIRVVAGRILRIPPSAPPPPQSGMRQRLTRPSRRR